MGVVDVVLRLVGVVFVMVLGASVAFLDRERVATSRPPALERLREVTPHVLVLVLVLVVNRLFRHLGQEFSWILDWNITPLIQAIENGLVAAIQSVATPWLTTYFVFAYVYGYSFLVVFPYVAYWVLEDSAPLRQTILAYATNYGLGLVLYTLFISYGPRNLRYGTVKPLLYDAYPQVQLLTSTVNANTNVFPSLHASLTITVVLLAYRTRETYPYWFLLSLVLTASVVVSTMYLGIHWALDVVGGGLVALVSVRIAARYRDLRLPTRPIRG